MAIETLKEIKRLGKFAIGEINVSEIRLIERNPRFMRKEVFDKLIENIKRDGQLSSIPFCYIDWGKRTCTVLSGNHRIRALRVLGVERTIIMYNVEEMSEDDKKRIQLAHNQIVGEDDISLLRELYNSISDVEIRKLTGLDDEFFEQLEPVTTSLVETEDFDVLSVSLLFISDRFERVIKELKEYTSDAFIYMGEKEKFDCYLEVTKKLSEVYNVYNGAIIFEILLKVYKEYIENHRNGFDGGIAIDGNLPFRIGDFTSIITEENAKTLRNLIKESGGINEFVEKLKVRPRRNKKK